MIPHMVHRCYCEAQLPAKSNLFLECLVHRFVLPVLMSYLLHTTIDQALLHSLMSVKTYQPSPLANISFWNNITSEPPLSIPIRNSHIR